MMTELSEVLIRVHWLILARLHRPLSLGIGFITDNTILDLELTAMESTGNGEVISQPKVVTSDKETAKILKGTEIPYQEASSSGATTTQFKDAVLSLEVTPQITPDDQVIMDVKVTKDELDILYENQWRAANQNQ